MTARELATAARVQLVTVYQWIRSGRLGRVKRRGAGPTAPWMIPRAAARRVIAKRLKIAKARKKSRELCYRDDGRFGLFVSKRRKLMTLTLGGLARASGLSVSYVSKLEAGQRRPTIRTIEKLAPALGLKTDALITVLAAASR